MVGKGECKSSGKVKEGMEGVDLPLDRRLDGCESCKVAQSQGCVLVLYSGSHIF